jgi:hypothetical protein
VACNQNAGTPLGQRYLAELGFCMIEQLVKSTRVGNEDFQMLDGLTKHDEQLPFLGLRVPSICKPLILRGVPCFKLDTG